jgi:hypothetical protein
MLKNIEIRASLILALALISGLVLKVACNLALLLFINIKLRYDVRNVRKLNDVQKTSLNRVKKKKPKIQKTL